MVKLPNAVMQPQRGDREGDEVSLHTTRSDYEHQDAPDLPSYDDSQQEAAASEAASSSQQVELRRCAVPPSTRDDPYLPQRQGDGGLQQTVSKPQNLKETSIRMDARLEDPKNLKQYIQGYLQVVPPRPCIRLMGSHQETSYNASKKKNETERVVDFDIMISLQRFLGSHDDQRFWAALPASNSDKVYRGSWRKTRSKGYTRDIEIGDDDVRSLGDWCRDYCCNKSALKVFRVTRSVDGLDTEYLKGQIERIVRDTYYYGNISITFPVEDKNVDIYSDHWVNKVRLSVWRYLFYVTFLWLITWPILFFVTKRWTVYSVHWRWFYHEQNHEQLRTPKVFATVSDRQWLEMHENLLKSLILEKFHGDATEFPPDVPDERVQRAMRTRVFSTGDQSINAVVDLVSEGVNLWQTAQGRQMRDPRSWGRDC